MLFLEKIELKIICFSKDYYMELELDNDIYLKTLTGFGQTGLYNLGNTCYLNTAIQCLSAIKPLSYYFLNNLYVNEINNKAEHEVSDEYAELMKKIWSSNTRYSPKNFKQIIGKFYEPFLTRDQQDSAEAYSKILELLHIGLSYGVDFNEPICGPIYRHALNKWKEEFENNYSLIVRLFYGQFWSRTKCDICQNITNKFEPFSLINLPINEVTNTLEDCIDNFTNCEDMHTDNMIDCEKCMKKCSGKKKISVWRLPPVLVFCFNRFDDSGRKINKLIDFPINKTIFNNLVEKKNDKLAVYDLVSIANHSGSLGGGHYWAYCKGANSNWYEFDDDRITEMDVSHLVSSTAYYIIYLRRDLECDDIFIT